MSTSTHWQTYHTALTRYPELGFSIDTSRMDLPSNLASTLSSEITRAYNGIQAIESGEIANPDEARMVGHYWLRNPELAPNDEIKQQITQPITDLKEFAKKIQKNYFGR